MAQQQQQEVLYSSKNHVAFITLNRPEKLNAMNEALLNGIRENIDRANAEPNIRVIILHGNGPAFCAGADISTKLFNKLDNRDRGKKSFDFITGPFFKTIKSITLSQKPIIAACHGAAAGGGLSLAMACDFLIMSEKSYILQAFINIGLVPDGGSSYFLAKKLGYSKALEISMEGKPLPAKVCKELGLAYKVVPETELMKTCETWAEYLSQKPSFAIQMTKNAVQHALGSTLDDVMIYEARIQQFCVETEDHKEGV